MTTNPLKTLRRAVLLPALLALGTSLALTSCSDSSSGGVSKSATPDEVFKAYVTALNEGNVEAALSMLADPGDMTPENTEWVEGIATEFPDPLLRSELELADEVESTNLYFDFIREKPYDVSFVKIDDSWKIEKPLFFLQSMAKSEKQSAEESPVDRTHSTWWEVIEDLDITAATSTGAKFNFPEYLAGVAVFPPTYGSNAEPVTVDLTMTPLPETGVLEKTEFSVFSLELEEDRYDINAIHFATDPLDPKLLSEATELARQTKRNIGEYSNAVDVLPSAVECNSELFFRNEKGDFSVVSGTYDEGAKFIVPAAPEVKPRDEYAPRIVCEALLADPDPDSGYEEITHMYFNYFPATGEVRPYDNSTMP